jgi:SRSO17 transposase
MTPDDVRTAAEQRVDFHERFAPLFGKEQAQLHAYDSLKGLMVCPERKSIEPIALHVGHGDVSGLQKFLGAGPWAHEDDVTFRTQPQIAAELVRNVAVLGQVELDWVVGDSEYGRAGHLLDELELLGQRYVLEVPVTWVFWTADPAGSIPAYSGRGRKPTAPAREAARTAAQIAHELPASAWTALRVREGAVGPLVFEFAAVRVWGLRHRKPGPPSWLLIRRSLDAEPELKCYVSNADAETPLATLALVACTRCHVEQFLEDCKSYLGMTQYEMRSYVGWHHHMTLVGLAHLFVTLVQKRLKKRTPELTLDRTVRLLEAALAEPQSRLARAIALVD